MKLAIAGLIAAAGIGIAAGDLAGQAWAQDAAKGPRANLPPLAREEGAPPPTVDLKDLSLGSGAAPRSAVRAPSPSRLQGGSGGAPAASRLKGDAGLAESGQSSEERARRP